MIDIKEVNKAIAALECGNTTYEAISKLAMLYTVRDHMQQEKEVKRYSYAAGPGESEFLAASLRKNPEDVFRILDGHIETIKALYPREYETILKRINSL